MSYDDNDDNFDFNDTGLDTDMIHSSNGDNDDVMMAHHFTDSTNSENDPTVLANVTNDIKAPMHTNTTTIRVNTNNNNNNNNKTSINANNIHSNSTNNETSKNSTTFQRYDGVVIVTKVLWSKDKVLLERMLCYVSAAYNDKVQYDIVVFTTMPWSDDEIMKLQKVVAPAKLTVALEGPSLEEQVSAMSEEERQFLFKRCNATKENPISWHHHCTEPNSTQLANLGYAYQAEFRSYHVWNHPAIKDYKYMMWFDSDCRIGKEWDQDPMKMMIENDLTLLFAGFPYGKTGNQNVVDKIKNVYNKTQCRNTPKLVDGHLGPFICNSKGLIHQISGNHHITNLEVYRKDIHQRFLKSFVGDYRFSRDNDDQLAVTIPATIEHDGKKSWHQRSHGLILKIDHHGMYDVEEKEQTRRNFKNFYQEVVKDWPALKGRCRMV